MSAALQDYYARRAATYERIYLKPERQAELRALQAWLPGVFAGRRVLEIACGTGWWTPHGARDAASWLATDLNTQTLAIARGKAMPPCVRLAELDAWRLETLSAQCFDAAFAGFWWSHVERARLPGWLATLHARLQPGARVVFIDNRFVPGCSTPIARTDAAGDSWQRRTLDDGSVHEVLKNFPSRDDALAAIGPGARDIEWITHPHYWVLGYTVG
ncbi:MAG TPA: class I SAM-dependent methyltransferase [Rubrivivax sp.]|nr:class I SAM-dependent methyltransferase [Rubrivivax sp.]